MTRHPVSDERSVVGGPGNRLEVERFFCADLAKHLRVSTRQLQEVARQKRLDHYVAVMNKGAFCGGESHMWVTRRGARLLIEHFRAMQGKAWEEGRDWDEERNKRIEARKRRTAREKAARERACAGVQLAPERPSR